MNERTRYNTCADGPRCFITVCTVVIIHIIIHVMIHVSGIYVYILVTYIYIYVLYI